MIDTDKYKCPHCKTEYDENDVWHDVIDLQLWKTTSICEGCFEEDGGSRYMNSTDVESLTSEVKRLREELQKVCSHFDYSMTMTGFVCNACGKGEEE